MTISALPRSVLVRQLDLSSIDRLNEQLLAKPPRGRPPLLALRFAPG